MTDETLNRIKMESNKYRLNPPDRVWNRLEYKLDRFELKKKEHSKSRILYLGSIAAVLVILIGIISLLKSDIRELSVYEKSEILIEEMRSSDNMHEAYNIHKLKNYYDKLNTSRFKNNSTSIRVNTNIEG